MITRRRFIQQTGSAFGMLAAGDTLLRASEPAGLTLGFNTYGMQSMKTDDAVRHIARIGYDSVELAVYAGWDSETSRLDAGRRRDLRTLIADEGLVLTALMENLRPSLDDQRHAATMERLNRTMHLAHDLSPGNPPLIETTLGRGDFAQVRPVFLRRLAEWVKIAEKHECVIAIKPHRFNAMSRPEQAIGVIRELGDPQRLRINYDYSHYALRDMPLKETIQRALPYTAFVAIKDTIMDGGQARFRLPGTTGDIDYVTLLREFHQGGYRGDINCEVSVHLWGQDGYDPIVAARTCYQHIAPLFAQAGVRRRSRA